MKTRTLGLYAIALTIVAVVALWAGASAGTVIIFGLILAACPLMMFLMMRGIHGGMRAGGRGAANHDDRADPPAPPHRPTSHEHGTTR